MNDRSKESQLLLGLLAILMLVTSVVLFAQQIPPTSSGVSKGQTEGARPQDSFVPSYITHSPITITSNADFVSQGFSGNGTAEDPYVIEGYNITTTGTCISIQDTDACFVIRDCLLTGGSSGTGVRLDGVDHGEIRNNNISGIDDCGVYLRYSTGNTIVNNTMSGNNNSVFFVFSSSNNTVVNNTISGSYRFGVFIGYSSNDNTVVNNTISGNDAGMIIVFSSDNTVVNNTISGYDCDGVRLYSSSNNTLSSNNFVNNGIRISGDVLEYWRHFITTDNLVNGKLLGYFWNLTSGIIDGIQYGQVILANCTGVTVEDGLFSNASVGIALGYSSYCSLMNNTISGNIDGVYLFSSSNNTVVNNTISGNDYGMYLDYLSGNNLIYLNVFADNDGNACDDGARNNWSITGIGNYWSDYSGTGEYRIPGSAISIDYYPFIYPPETTVPPQTTTSTTTTTTSTSTTTPIGDVTGLVIVFLGVGGIGVVVVVLVLMRYRKGSMTGS